MTTLTIMRGISGSGKSTVAEELAAQTNATVVSPDLIRLALSGDDLASGVDAQLLAWMEYSFIETCLANNRNVISDDINIAWIRVKKLARIGYRNQSKVVLRTLDTPLETCLKNNAHRAMMGGRHVPEISIRRQYEYFQKDKDKKLYEILYE